MLHFCLTTKQERRAERVYFPILYTQWSIRMRKERFLGEEEMPIYYLCADWHWHLIHFSSCQPVVSVNKEGKLREKRKRGRILDHILGWGTQPGIFYTLRISSECVSFSGCHSFPIFFVACCTAGKHIICSYLSWLQLNEVMQRNKVIMTSGKR